jgi:HSP20 family protein
MAQMHELINSMTAFEEGWSELSVTPSLSIQDTESAYEITLQLPGIDKSGIQVTMDGTILNIIVEYNEHRAAPAPGGGANWQTHQEGRFERRLRLPSATSRHDAIKATFKDGLLRVRVPKATGAESTVGRITVNESAQEETKVTTPEAP